jgi:hypothetical protein
MKRYILIILILILSYFLISYIENNGNPEIKEIKKVLNESEIFSN